MRTGKNLQVAIGMSVLVGLAFASRYIAGIIQSSATDYWDSGNSSYFMIAENLVYGEGYALVAGSPTIWRNPLYPLLLAGIYSISGKSVPAFIAGNSLLGVLVVLAGFFVARAVFQSLSVGILAALLVSIYPYLVFHSSHLFETSLISLLVLLLVLAAIETHKEGSYIWAALAGILMGLSVLTKSSALSLMPIFIVWWISLSYRKFKRRILVASFLFLSFTGIVLLPWAIRNKIVLDHLTVSESNLGFNLWKGNNPLTFAVYPMTHLDSLDEYAAWILPADSTAKYWPESEWFQHQALEYIRKDPMRFLKGLARKSLQLYDWNIIPYLEGKAVIDPVTETITMPASSRSPTKQLSYTIPYIFVVTFVLIGFLGSIKRNWEILFLVIPILIIWSIGHAVAFTITRFRMPIEPLILIWAAYGMKSVGNAILTLLKFRSYQVV